MATSSASLAIARRTEPHAGIDARQVSRSRRFACPVWREKDDRPDIEATTRRTEERTVQMSGIPFGTTDWSEVERTQHEGETGLAYWRTKHFGGIRVRMVEYTPGYVADHWCSKGHILLCIAGELLTELEDGRRFTLGPGMSYQVADHAQPHRSSTEVGATLFIVD
jgi:hypothetical protein